MENLAKEKFGKVEARMKPADNEVAAGRIVMNQASGTEEMFTVKAEVSFAGNDYFSDETSYTLENALVNTVNELIRMMERDKPEH
jgi:hypothetical protein